MVVRFLPWLKARAIVCNDKNALVINFYRVLGGVFGAKKERQKLIDLCQSTLSHPEEAELAQHYLDQPEGFSPTLKAWGYWCLCWVCRKGKGGTKHLAVSPLFAGLLKVELMQPGSLRPQRI